MEKYQSKVTSKRAALSPRTEIKLLSLGFKCLAMSPAKTPEIPYLWVVDRDLPAAHHRALVDWASRPKFHQASGAPLEEVIEWGDRLWALGGSKALESTIEALPIMRDRIELNYAFSSVGQWLPLWKYRIERPFL